MFDASRCGRLDLIAQGGGHAIINCLFDHIRKNDNVTIMWETQVRKADGRMTKVHGKKVMLACGGFEGNREMWAGGSANLTFANVQQVGPICWPSD
jgi:hypothetical protein